MNVVVVKCAGYDRAALADAMTRLLAGMDSPCLRAGRPLRVLIKPNMLTDKPPDAAATTHPEVVRAIIHAVRRHGHLPVVADSAASPQKMERVWAVTGFAAMCAEEHVPLLNLEQAGAQMFEYEGVPFGIARPVLEADLVINAPKLKTHLLTTITNAVKNVYGVIPGARKTALHKIFPTPDMLGAFLAHLYQIVCPGLTICDAVVGMQGNGPASGQPVRLGFLAASPDGVALDMAVCRLLGIDPRVVPYLTPAQKSVAPAPPVVIIGDFGDGALPPDFKLPVTLARRLIPGRLVRWLRPYLWSKPEFTAVCVRCGRCVAGCPVAAIAMPAAGPPVLNRAACIECACCSEVCPVDAVRTRQSRLLRGVQFARAVLRRMI